MKKYSQSPKPSSFPPSLSAEKWAPFIVSEAIARCGCSDDTSIPEIGDNSMKKVTLEQLQEQIVVVSECEGRVSRCSQKSLEADRKTRNALDRFTAADEALRRAVMKYEKAKAVLLPAHAESKVAANDDKMAVEAMLYAQDYYYHLLDIADPLLRKQYLSDEPEF